MHIVHIDLYVQTTSSPGLDIVHAALSILDHICVALFTCPFAPSLHHSPAEISVYVFVNSIPMTTNLAPQSEREETTSKILLRHGSNKYICLAK